MLARSGVRLASAVALAAIAGCVSPAATTAPAAPAPTAQQLAEQHRICDAVVVAIREGRPEAPQVLAGCGASSLGRADAVFEAASLSKPVFAYLVLKLVQQRRIDLDAPVVRHLPQGYLHLHDPFDGSPPAADRTDRVADPRLAAVTVRMLLSHTAGLPNWAHGPLAFGADPGTAWRYSGEGYLLLQRAVEAVTGQPLEQLARQEVFVPLAMTSSAFAWEERLAGRMAAPHAGDTARPVRRFARAVAASTLITTAGDYARFVAAVLADPVLLAATTDGAVDVDPALGLAWGLGWGLERRPQGPVLWHWGSNPGYRAFVMALPASGNGLVLLTGSDQGLQLVRTLAAAALPADEAARRLYDFRMLRLPPLPR